MQIYRVFVCGPNCFACTFVVCALRYRLCETWFISIYDVCVCMCECNRCLHKSMSRTHIIAKWNVVVVVVVVFFTFNYVPEHLKSCSCKSATLWPFNWLGEWHRVYGAKRGELRKNRASHDRWQSHANGLSDNRSARMRGIPLKISRGNAVMLLLFSVL